LPPSLIVGTGERIARRKDYRVAWNSSFNANLPLTQVRNAATEKQNGEGSSPPLRKTAQVEICLLTVRDQEGSRAPSIHCSACRNSERLIYALTGQVGPGTGLRMLESVPSTRQIACTQYRPASKLHLRGVITDAHSRIYAHPLSYMFFRRISRLC
jgi:hypothetical protein